MLGRAPHTEVGRQVGEEGPVVGADRRVVADDPPGRDRHHEVRRRGQLLSSGEGPVPGRFPHRQRAFQAPRGTDRYDLEPEFGPTVGQFGSRRGPAGRQWCRAHEPGQRTGSGSDHLGPGQHRSLQYGKPPSQRRGEPGHDSARSGEDVRPVASSIGRMEDAVGVRSQQLVAVAVQQCPHRGAVLAEQPLGLAVPLQLQQSDAPFFEEPRRPGQDETLGALDIDLETVDDAITDDVVEPMDRDDLAGTGNVVGE